MPKVVLNPASVPRGTDAYSQLVEANGLVFVAGQVGTLPGGPPALEFAAEARGAFDNLGRLLMAADLGMEDVVRCTVYLVDFGDFPAMDAAFREYFPVRPPTRTTVGVTALARDCRIEIEATAAR